MDSQSTVVAKLSALTDDGFVPIPLIPEDRDVDSFAAHHLMAPCCAKWMPLIGKLQVNGKGFPSGVEVAL